jgi:hypothetical protein
MVRDCGSYESKIRGQRPIEQNGIPRQVADVLAQTFEANAPNVFASDAD